MDDIGVDWWMDANKRWHRGRSVRPRRARGWVGPPPPVRELDWREHAEGGVGSVGVVLGPPIGDEDLGFEERVELLDGEQFVAHAAATDAWAQRRR